MSNTNTLFDMFLTLPLDTPRMVPIATENKLKSLRSSLYKARKFYEQQTRSSVFMQLRKVEMEGQLFLEMTRTSTLFEWFEIVDGKLTKVPLPKVSDPLAMRDISGPSPEPISAAAIRRRLGQLQEDNVDPEAQEVYLETEFPEPEEKALIKELLASFACPKQSLEALVDQAKLKQDLVPNELCLKHRELQAKGLSLEECLEELQKTFQLSQEEVFRELDKPQDLAL